RNTLDLSTVETLVLDEADRMVDMGFYEEIVGIVAACPRKRQTLLFSATYPDNIRKQSARFLKNPVEVKVESLHDAGHIEQHFYKIQPERRVATVAALLGHFRPVSTIAFCNTKQQVRELANELQQQGFSALALYGELEQRERDEILVQFANRSCSVLVATDVAARGLDISTLEAVINVDLSHDPEIHIHRIGRTGRGGEKGLALSLVGPNDSKRLALIEDYQQAKPNWADPAALTSGGGPLVPPMVTLCIAAGRKDKVRPGDILGALTGEAGIAGQQVGKISVFEFACYVALDRSIAQQAFSRLAEGRIKGRSFKMRFVGA
ncbi:MAG: DbpA RNA binding domain-containing protein, partial [Pseudogulbenkiania sp.]|nr:DbpA RNA binding domain-containing protein [Pseudogulbenkiania sp.]